MFVVPVAGDKVRTQDDSNYRVVSSYTNLKDEPSVYLTPGSSADRFLHFSDIVELNGVKVEYDNTSKTFNALGPLRRKFNLPQPRDTITVKLIDVPFKQEEAELEVSGLRLHNQRLGVSRGLLVICGESSFSLNELLDIKRNQGSERFDPKRFQRYYFDYLAVRVKATRSR